MHSLFRLLSESEEPHTVDSSTIPGTDHHSDHEPSEVLVVLWVFITFLIGATLHEIQKKTKIPYTPMLLGVGILFGVFAEDMGLVGKATLLMVEINPHGFLIIFIPTLIFESAFNADWHVFKKEFWSIFILAGPGVLITVGLLAVIFKVILNYDDNALDWYGALTIGTILATTDPVAVVALLKQLGAPVTFNTLIEGESLLNDGSAMVFFAIFAELSKGNETNFGEALVTFIRLSGGGVILGIAFGIGLSFWISRIEEDRNLTIMLTFITAHLCFYVAENTALMVSSILAVVTLGLFMAAYGRSKMSAEIEESLHAVWSWAQFGVETLIFFLSGAIIGNEISGTDEFIEGSDWWKMVLFFLLMNIVRLIVVLAATPILGKIGYGLSWRAAVVLAYGGLRGTLGLALALIVGIDTFFPERMRKLAVFYMAGIATLSLMINGTTTGFMVRKLGVAKRPEIKKKVQMVIYTQLAIFTNGAIKELEEEKKHYKMCDFDAVKKLVKFDDMIKEVYKRDTSFDQRESTTTLKRTLTTRLSNAEFHDIRMEVETRYRLLTMVKGLVLEKFEEGVLSSDSMRTLREACNFNIDDPERPIWLWQRIQEAFNRDRLIRPLTQLKSWFLLGNLAKRILGGKIYYIYDVTSTFIMVAEELIKNEGEIPVAKMYIKVPLEELRKQKILAEAYLEGIEFNYDYLIRQVSTRRAAYHLLHGQKKQLIEALKEGRIDSIEFERLVASVQQQMNFLHKSVEYNWGVEDRGYSHLIVKFPILGYLNQESQRSISQQLKTSSFVIDQPLFKKGDEVKYLYLVAKGVVEEDLGEKDKIRRSIGSVIGYPHLIEGSGAALYNATAKSNARISQIPLDLLKDFMKTNPSFDEKIYKNCLYYMVKIHKQESGELAYLLKDEAMLNRIAQDSTLKTWSSQKNENFKLSNGAYIFSGKVKAIDTLPAPSSAKTLEPSAKTFKNTLKVPNIKQQDEPVTFEYDRYYYLPPFEDRNYSPVGHVVILELNEPLGELRNTKGDRVFSGPDVDKRKQTANASHSMANMKRYLSINLELDQKMKEQLRSKYKEKQKTLIINEEASKKTVKPSNFGKSKDNNRVETSQELITPRANGTIPTNIELPDTDRPMRPVSRFKPEYELDTEHSVAQEAVINLPTDREIESKGLFEH